MAISYDFGYSIDLCRSVKKVIIKLDYDYDILMDDLMFSAIAEQLCEQNKQYLEVRKAIFSKDAKRFRRAFRAALLLNGGPGKVFKDGVVEDINYSHSPAIIKEYLRYFSLRTFLESFSVWCEECFKQIMRHFNSRAYKDESNASSQLTIYLIKCEQYERLSSIFANRRFDMDLADADTITYTLLQAAIKMKKEIQTLKSK